MRFFAYGSELRGEAMGELLGRPLVATRARLRGFRLAFTAFAEDWGGGVADIVEDEESEVEGVVFDLEPADALRLEFHEGLSDGLYRPRRVTVELEQGGEADALAYEVARKRTHVRPSPAYLDSMVSGATEQGLSEGYVNWLLQLYPDEPTPHNPAWAEDE